LDESVQELYSYRGNRGKNGGALCPSGNINSEIYEALSPLFPEGIEQRLNAEEEADSRQLAPGQCADEYASASMKSVTMVFSPFSSTTTHPMTTTSLST